MHLLQLESQYNEIAMDAHARCICAWDKYYPGQHFSHSQVPPHIIMA
jgi:hypothetical protein